MEPATGNEAGHLACTMVIATYERPEDLVRMLESISRQERKPAMTILIDASKSGSTRAVFENFAAKLPLRYERAIVPSAAEQRNQGALLVQTPLIAFADDDDVLMPDTCEKLCAVFDDDSLGQIGGVAGRIAGMERPPPRGPLWWYYRLQAGFSHPTYGGKLFGPAINCYPSYTEPSSGDLIAADWLNSTCVVYRTGVFLRERFPSFQGYSFMEDVHLSARIAKTHRLYFHTTALFEHHDAPSTWKRDFGGMARSRIRNQRIVARDLLGQHGASFQLRMLLHRIFVTIYVLRRRGAGTIAELMGTWSA